MTAPVPAGMVVVTRDQFFDYVMNATVDIKPSQQSPDYTAWEVYPRREVARSLPGWRRPGDPKVYMLTEASLAEVTKRAAK